MTDYQKGMLVMDYLRSLQVDSSAILDAICDENLERSYKLIRDNPRIGKNEFLTKMGISED